MWISTNMIFEKISSVNPVCEKAETYKATFKRIKLFTSFDLCDSMDVLYIATMEQLTKQMELRNPDSIPPIWLLCPSDAGFREKYKSSPINFIWCSVQSDLSMIFNTLQDAFFAFDQWREKIKEVTLTGAGVGQIVDCSKKFVKAPIMIWDASMQMIYCSEDVKDIQLDWVQNMLKSGYFPPLIVKHLIARDLLTRPECENVTRLVTDTFSRKPFYVRSYFENKKRIYSVGAYDIEETLTPCDMEYLELCFNAIGEYFKYCKQNPGEYLEAQDLIYTGIITGRLSGEKDIAQRASSFEIPFIENCQLFSFEFVEEDNPRISFLVTDLANIPRKSKVFVIDNHLIYLLSKGAGEEQLHKEDSYVFDEISKLLVYYKLSCGVSIPFGRLDMLKNAFHQAVTAAKYGRALGTGESLFKMHYYRDYAWMHLLDVYNETMDGKQLCLPQVIKLHQEDIKKHTNNIDLLETYLFCNFSTAKTASALHLHRNSILYRINRLEEQLGFSLTEKDGVLDDLTLSLKIIRQFYC